MTFFPLLPMFAGFTAFTPEVPKLYWDVKSQEQRILEICKHLDKLTNYTELLATRINDLDSQTNAQFDQFEKDVNAKLAQQDEKIQNAIDEQNANIEKQLKELKSYIDDRFDNIAKSSLVYDVTTGTFRPSIETMRRIYSALAFSNTGPRALVSELAQTMTVAQLAAMTAYRAAWSDRDTITIDDQTPTIQGEANAGN